MTQDNDGWGTPVPVANAMLQSQNAAADMQKLETQMRADGWTSVVPGEWNAPASQSFEAETNGNDMNLTTTPTQDGWAAYVAKNYDDDGNGNLTAKREYVEGPDAWPVNPEDAGKPAPWLMPDDVASAYDTAGLDDELVQQSFSEIADEKLLYESTDQDRAEAANACAETPGDEWFVDIPDGELTRKTDYVPTVTDDEPTGFYIAYSQGILHAVLAGPYDGLNNANAAKDRAWAAFQADPNFALAFAKDGYNPSGVYVAEIPLKARRRGAYGPI